MGSGFGARGAHQSTRDSQRNLIHRAPPFYANWLQANVKVGSRARLDRQASSTSSEDGS